MKVLFKKDVEGVARAGQVKEVADGHARNFLIPRGLAVPATEAAVKQAAAQQASAARRAAEEQQEARKLKARLEADPIVLESKAGPGGRLYGSVTGTDVVEAVKRQLGVSLDKRDLELEQPIRTVGTHRASVRLHRAVTAALALDVRTAGG